MSKKLTLKEFIKRAKKIHGKKYCYEEVNFSNLHDKVSITCPEHGKFEQIANNHINGSSCPSCSTFYKLDLLEFIKRSKIKHNNKYDYSKSFYAGALNPINIFCKNCEKEFTQGTARAHYQGQGCPNCCRPNKKMSTADFIKRSSLKHDNKYTYDKCQYISSKIKVSITCPYHGEFMQAAPHHLNGHGCPTCSYSVSKMENDWLDSIFIKKEFRQKYIQTKNKKYSVDAYVPETNTVYEFHGDYWHGNPNKYKGEDINKRVGKSFSYLYNLTLKKEKDILDAGFKLIIMWESQWKNK